MINLGVIGCGYWGPNHIRNLFFDKNANIVGCADLNKKRLMDMKKLYRTLAITTNYTDLLKNKNIDAIVVATPTKTHYKIARDCLLYDKDVLCEKPLAFSVKEAEELVMLAEKKEKILMVGNVFLFNAGVRKIKEYIQKGALGNIYYLYSTRTSLGPVRRDVSPVYDLAAHDIYIFSYLLQKRPVEVIARGECFLQEDIEDVAFISLAYHDKIIAHIHVSWLDPQKIRQITVVGDKKMAVWDDLNNIEPVKLYDKGATEKPYYKDFAEFQFLLKDSDVLIPKINLVEPLKAQDAYFLKCIKERQKPLYCSGEDGLECVKILKAISTSLKNGKTKINC
jgi:predicted dehydrogenase